MTRLDRGREYGMGFWKNLRAGAAFMREYQQDAMKTVPRWARVVRVGRRVFGMVGVDVEIHYGRTPPHVESVSVSVPRGMQLQAGQDVFVVEGDGALSDVPGEHARGVRLYGRTPRELGILR